MPVYIEAVGPKHVLAARQDESNEFRALLALLHVSYFGGHLQRGCGGPGVRKKIILMFTTALFEQGAGGHSHSIRIVRIGNAAALAAATRALANAKTGAPPKRLKERRKGARKATKIIKGSKHHLVRDHERKKGLACVSLHSLDVVTGPDYSWFDQQN
eukprot:CAMPEP_0206430016 /NCGR_PEP_ID=MMETSP0324_2-20121206/6572_1 /ASSEMBLY_ACC=CAM_ASM_000836 /TAXON_ID=2866 /ORGANISM="Crypthecodinium cohnii, Strain Seligo" /LENGTH=157 /DNA_ID=CAMNT_0053895781 /DNA_START=53 /DNA_END=523 /DNA_ORIENTATION=-